MTFDARKGNNAPTSGRQNLLFAGVTLTLVCGAFFAVLSLPHKAETPMRPRAETASVVQTAALPRLPGEAAQAYYVALGRVDVKAQADLRARIARAGGVEARELANLVLEHAGEVLQDHAGELAMADTKHLDRLLELARNKLRAASRKGSKWCRATHYAGLQEIGFRRPDVLRQELAEFEAPMRDFAFEALTGLMGAVEDARQRPVRRGSLTRADEAALQGMVMSIMSDPDFMPVMISVQSGADPEKALKGVNACNLAATAVSAAKTLPQETKGRLLAEAMGEFGKNGPSAFRRGVGF